MDDEVYDQPSETEAVKGNVAVMGPDGVSVVFTPDAALETSDRLLNTAVEARGQSLDVERVQKERRAFGFDDDK